MTNFHKTDAMFYQIQQSIRRTITRRFYDLDLTKNCARINLILKLYFFT